MAKRKSRKKKSFIIFLLVCVIVFFGVRAGYNAMMTYLYPHKYSEFVEKYAAEYEIDEILLYSVIKTESGFNPDSVSYADARGLTQITEDTFDWLLTKTGEDYVFDDLFTPEISIKYGALFLSILQREYGVTETVAAAYHAGMGNVSSWLSDSEYSHDGVHLVKIPIPDTAHYVDKVMSAMDKYYNLYEAG